MAVHWVYHIHTSIITKSWGRSPDSSPSGSISKICDSQNLTVCHHIKMSIIWSYTNRSQTYHIILPGISQYILISAHYIATMWIRIYIHTYIYIQYIYIYTYTYIHITHIYIYSIYTYIHIHIYILHIYIYIYILHIYIHIQYIYIYAILCSYLHLFTGTSVNMKGASQRQGSAMGCMIHGALKLPGTSMAAIGGRGPKMLGSCGLNHGNDGILRWFHGDFTVISWWCYGDFMVISWDLMWFYGI